jgi:hypothetical protein
MIPGNRDSVLIRGSRCQHAPWSRGGEEPSGRGAGGQMPAN